MECPQGYHHRKEYHVDAGCINNKRNSRLIDPRCPEGMHWREAHFVKGKCVRKSKARLRKQNQDSLLSPVEKLPSCTPDIVQRYWTNHLKLIEALEKKSLSNKEVNKIYRRFVKTLQKKLDAHHCLYSPTEEERLELYDTIFSTVSDSELLKDSVSFLEELYHLYVLFHLFDELSGASLNNRGKELLRRYNDLLNRLSVYQREQRQRTLTEAQLKQYVRNYGESQLNPVTLQQLHIRYQGPFWTQSSVTVHCPHCNHVVRVTHYVPNTTIQCPYCQGAIKLK